MSIDKIGMYKIDEILEFMTEGEGRGFLGRSMFDAMYFEIERLNNDIKVLLKENGNKEKVIKAQDSIIKEVREELKILKELEDFSVVKLQLTNIVFRLDKENI